jgi:hypothetical protein
VAALAEVCFGPVTEKVEFAMTVQEQSLNVPVSPGTAEVIIRAVVLAISCVISYVLIVHILSNRYSISEHDDLLGGMWAMVSTIFVYRYSHAESIRLALSRMAATLFSFALCLVYLLFWPFHLWGMAALIAIGAVLVTLMGRPDDTITTGITTVVVMIVASMSPHDAWREPVLRVVDTALGVIVGVFAAWITNAGIGRLPVRPRA